MLKNKKGFSLIELVVVIAILAVFAAILVPSLLQYTENSRAQKDESAMDEVVNAVQLALADQDCFDEMLQYSCTNNFVTYSDSTGDYASQVVDGEFWAPDGAGRATTITFNPETGYNNSTVYKMDTAIINDMTYGNGSVAHDRVMEGALIDNNQCYLKNASLNSNTTGYMYNRVRQTIGDSVVSTSQTYRNSSFTVFIRFTQKDGVTVAEVHGQFNGTNLYEGAPASIGTGTTEYEPDTGVPIVTVTNPGTQNSEYVSSDLSGGGDFSPDYKQNVSQTEKVDESLVFSTSLHVRYNLGGSFYITKQLYEQYDSTYFVFTDEAGTKTQQYINTTTHDGKLMGYTLELKLVEAVDKYDVQVFGVKDGTTYAGQKIENWSILNSFIKDNPPATTIEKEYRSATVAYISYMQQYFGYKTDELAIDKAPEWMIKIINNHQPITVEQYKNDESGYDVKLSEDNPYFKLDTSSSIGFTFESNTKWGNGKYAIVKYEGMTKRFEVPTCISEGKTYEYYGRFEIADIWPNHGTLPIEVTLYDNNGTQISTTYTFKPISIASQKHESMAWYIQSCSNYFGVMDR